MTTPAILGICIDYRNHYSKELMRCIIFPDGKLEWVKHDQNDLGFDFGKVFVVMKIIGSEKKGQKTVGDKRYDIFEWEFESFGECEMDEGHPMTPGEAALY